MPPLTNDFDLDVAVVESAPTAEAPVASDGGCGATCGTSCVSSGA